MGLLGKVRGNSVPPLKRFTNFIDFKRFYHQMSLFEMMKTLLL